MGSTSRKLINGLFATIALVSLYLVLAMLFAYRGWLGRESMEFVHSLFFTHNFLFLCGILAVLGSFCTCWLKVEPGAGLVRQGFWLLITIVGGVVVCGLTLIFCSNFCYNIDSHLLTLTLSIPVDGVNIDVMATRVLPFGSVAAALPIMLLLFLLGGLACYRDDSFSYHPRL